MLVNLLDDSVIMLMYWKVFAEHFSWWLYCTFDEFLHLSEQLRMFDAEGRQ